MESLRLKRRKAVEDLVEDWDNDDFMIGNDEDLTFRSHNSAHTNSNANLHLGRRDSHSSFRSDRESFGGGDERHVHLPGDDEQSTLDAIAAATQAGIPIPTNVPPSALMGGTIKRLGGRKIKKIFQEDWGDDLELPTAGNALRLKAQDGTLFPDVLRQVSGSTNLSPAKQFMTTITQAAPPHELRPKVLAAPVNLDRFRDTDEDDDVFGDGGETIKAPKLRTQGSKPLSLITPPTPSPLKKKSTNGDEDNFEMDLELPTDGKLKLTSRKDIPKTPSLHFADDFDWGEGSLGTRFGGTRRDAYSNRSSSVSGLSPSIASSLTAESEDENFDGLIFPSGPLDLGERLVRRKQSRSPERLDIDMGESGKRTRSAKDRSPQRISSKPGMTKSGSTESDSSVPISPRSRLLQGSPTAGSPKSKSPQRSLPKQRSSKHAPLPVKDEEDPFSGLDFGDGNLFRSGKSTVHSNIKVKERRQASPVRPKTAVSITFTNKPVTATSSRLPRPMVGHERSQSTSLEPVSESGGPIPQKPSRRSQSRLGHSAQSSTSSVHTPTTPSAFQTSLPATPGRRELGQKASTGTLRNEPTTTSAQLLRLKRSLPVMRHGQSPAKPPTSRFDRPSSRTDSRAEPHRPQSGLRPKTPVDRSRPANESSAAQARKGSTPFLPAAVPQTQSHHVHAKSSRSFRRHDSDQGTEFRPLSRANMRTTMRSPSPRRPRNEKTTAEPVWQQISKPRRSRQFGDGHELDAFDDLPTSAHTESRYTKQPIGSGNRTLRNKLYQNVLPDRNTPSPVSPYSPARADHQPHFARDTAASRMAREAGLAQRAQPTGPLVPLTTQRVAQLSTRTNLTPHIPHSQHHRSKKTRKPPQLKPHLISNLNSAREPKVINGMTYNPTTFRWEGNENALNKFDVPASSPSTASVHPSMMRERDTSTPRPVLITNINASKNTKRVGDMVFDPQNMCWLKVDTSTPTTLRADDPMEGFNTMEEDDPFKDIPDLDDNKESTEAGQGGRASDIINDWLVGEEFDVGPEFIRRQHEEEARWRKKCEQWTGPSRSLDHRRWALRDLIIGR
ncbi:Uu.00g067820.m01.CDS01 [Anthostomella pinea]|uniref:Uu.00g067820.m01.CDS01 n=1 Tax=Anthostomella pinea TaxID=933095 RepID=A0AAI8VU72_9PEZI|nr:Uu.00g067820.m01.CDS01 [Anthostomella pinea]